MSTHVRRLALVVVAAVLAGTAGRAGAIGFILGETKEQLKLKYEVDVAEVVIDDRGTVLVTVVLTLEDEGRLKPLDEVQLVIPSRQPFKDGGYGADLVVSIDMKQGADGKRVGRVQFLPELAERAEIQLNTHALDGKTDPMTRLHHVIAVAKYLKQPPAGAAPAAPPATPAPATGSPGRR